MRKLEERLQKHIDLLVERYPALKSIEQSIIDAYLVMEECYENGGKLLIAGNGGSAADPEHIALGLFKFFFNKLGEIAPSLYSLLCLFNQISK